MLPAGAWTQKSLPKLPVDVPDVIVKPISPNGFCHEPQGRKFRNRDDNWIGPRDLNGDLRRLKPVSHDANCCSLTFTHRSFQVKAV